jgi:hypothetical protein
MSQEGRLRIVTTPDTNCLGTAVGDFAITSVNDIHIVSLPEGALNRVAQAVFTEETVTFNRAVTATATLRSDLLSSSIVPSDDAVGIVISSGPRPGGTLQLDDVVIKEGSIETDTLDAATSMTVPLLSVSDRVVLPSATVNCPAGRTLVTLANTSKLVQITPVDGSDARLKVVELESTRVVPPSASTPFNVKGKLLVDSDTEINTKLTVHAGAVVDTTLSVGASAVIGTSLSTGGSATVGTSLNFANASSAPIVVAAPFLSIDKLTQVPELRLGGATGEVLSPAAWGGKGVIKGTKAGQAVYMEGEGFVLVSSTDRTATPVAIKHASGTASVVYVDNGALTQPAPLSSGALRIYNSAGSASGVISADASGALSSTTRMTVPSIRLTGASEATDSTVITGISTGLEVDRAVRAPGYLLKDGAAVVQSMSPMPGGGASLSSRVSVPEVVVRPPTGSTGSDAIVTNVNGGDLQMRMNSVVLLPTSGSATTQTVTLTPRDSGLSLNPPALHLAQTNGSLVTLRGLSDGTLATNAPKLVYQQSGSTVSSLGLSDAKLSMTGLSTIDMDTICSITASRPVAGRTEMSLVSDTLRIGSANKCTLSAEPGGVLLGPGSSNNIRSTGVLSLQAPSIDLVARRPDQSWSAFKFTAGAKGELRVNDRDIGLTPYDALSLSATSSGPDPYGWHTYNTSGGSVAFYARNNLGTRPPLLRTVPESFVMPGFVDLQFAGSAPTTYISPSGGETTFNGAWVDVSFNTPISFKRIVTKLTTAGQVDKRPSIWRLLARTGAKDWSADPKDWREVARGGVLESTDAHSAEEKAYDCFRFTVSVVTSGEEVRCSQLQLWGVEAAVAVTPMNSFTGQHYVIPSEGLSMSDFVPGMVVVTGEGHDSIADGGFKGRGGMSALRLDSALPRVRLSSKPRDPSAFGVVDSVKRNRWISDYHDMRLVVNGLGEGCILVTNSEGAISAGDLLCTSTVPGFACNQCDPYVASYTVAKSTMSCDFNPRQVPKMEISRDASGEPSLDSEGLVVWHETGAWEPEYKAFDLGDGLRGALISCTYRCS